MRKTRSFFPASLALSLVNIFTGGTAAMAAPKLGDTAITLSTSYFNSSTSGFEFPPQANLDASLKNGAGPNVYDSQYRKSYGLSTVTSDAKVSTFDGGSAFTSIDDPGSDSYLGNTLAELDYNFILVGSPSGKLVPIVMYFADSVSVLGSSGSAVAETSAGIDSVHGSHVNVACAGENVCNSIGINYSGPQSVFSVLMSSQNLGSVTIRSYVHDSGTGNGGTYSALASAPIIKIAPGYDDGGLYNLVFGAGIGPIAAVPEPDTWVTILLGFAVIGGAIRHRRRTGVTLTSA